MNYLSVFANKITSDEALSGMTRLETLYLGANPLTRVTVLGQMPHLQVLHIGYCKFRSLDDLPNISTLHELYKLSLDDALLPPLELAFFRDFPKLKHLCLPQNTLDNIIYKGADKYSSWAGNVMLYLRNEGLLPPREKEEE